MAERYVTLIRHGHYERESQLLGGGDLTDKGIFQVEQLAQALRQQYPITTMYSSTLRRAVHTAHIIAKINGQMSFQQDDTLCEALFYIPTKDAQRFGDLSSEAVTAQRIRVAHAYNVYMIPAVGAADEHDVISTHGNVIRYFVMRAIGAPLELWTHIDVYHTGVTRFVVTSEEQVRLITHNEITHLPHRLWTVD
jgi:serine/threonine-protein phosphatase PGAM5